MMLEDDRVAERRQEQADAEHRALSSLILLTVVLSTDRFEARSSFTVEHPGRGFSAGANDGATRTKLARRTNVHAARDGSDSRSAEWCAAVTATEISLFGR